MPIMRFRFALSVESAIYNVKTCNEIARHELPAENRSFDSLFFFKFSSDAFSSFLSEFVCVCKQHRDTHIQTHSNVNNVQSETIV